MLKETKILLKAHFVYFCPVLSNLLIFKDLSEVILCLFCLFLSSVS